MAAVRIEDLLQIVFALLPAVIFAYQFFKGKTKLNDVKDACKAAINSNKEMLPLVKDERIKLALKTKISALQVVVNLIEGGIIRDNFVWELDEEVKALFRDENE